MRGDVACGHELTGHLEKHFFSVEFFYLASLKADALVFTFILLSSYQSRVGQFVSIIQSSFVPSDGRIESVLVSSRKKSNIGSLRCAPLRMIEIVALTVV